MRIYDSGLEGKHTECFNRLNELKRKGCLGEVVGGGAVYFPCPSKAGWRPQPTHNDGSPAMHGKNAFEAFSVSVSILLFITSEARNLNKERGFVT